MVNKTQVHSNIHKFKQVTNKTFFIVFSCLPSYRCSADKILFHLMKLIIVKITLLMTLPAESRIYLNLVLKENWQSV